MLVNNDNECFWALEGIIEGFSEALKNRDKKALNDSFKQLKIICEFLDNWDFDYD